MKKAIASLFVFLALCSPCLADWYDEAFNEELLCTSDYVIMSPDRSAAASAWSYTQWVALLPASAPMNWPMQAQMDYAADYTSCMGAYANAGSQYGTGEQKFSQRSSEWEYGNYLMDHGAYMDAYYKFVDCDNHTLQADTAYQNCFAYCASANFYGSGCLSLISQYGN